MYSIDGKQTLLQLDDVASRDDVDLISSNAFRRAFGKFEIDVGDGRAVTARLN